MYINFFKSAVTDKAERIEVKPEVCIKDVEELKGVDFRHTLIYVNGFQKNEKYKLKKTDICSIRYFPSDGDGGRVATGVMTGGASEIAYHALDIAERSLNIAEKLTNEIGSMISNAIGGIKKYDYENYLDQRDFSTKIYTTNVTNIIEAENAVKSPDMRGCTNKSGKDAPYPLAIGRSYFVPTLLAVPYITPADELGYKQTYHALYNLGYGKVNISNICLGLHLLASNVAKQRNGAITIDGEYDQSRYNIHLEIQETAEVSLYNQKVIQQDINEELTYPYDPTGQITHGLILDEFSSLYPKKVEIEFYFDGLVGRTSDGKDTNGIIKLKVEYSTDGGNTYHPFAQVGNVSGTSYDSSTGETTLNMKNYHSMRLVASKEFSAGEVFNATNHVIEFRIQRTNVHKDDDFIYDTVSLASIRTYTYDPELSSISNLVNQAPVCEKDRQRITRLGFTITSDEYLFNLGELNMIVQALGRTCTENDGYYTWSGVNELSETSNPASMALRVLQSGMLGEYAYDDSEIDLQSFGELYKFCNEYDIRDARGNHVGLCANGVVTKQMKLAELVAKILKTGRAFRVVRNGKINVFVDKQISYTSLILNNQNVLSADNSKNFDELPSGIKAGFINEDNFNQEDVMYVDYPNAPARSSSSYKTIPMSFEFQTNVEQIKKNGLYELAKMKLRPEVWERKVTSEGCLAFVGAKIEVQDDTIAVGIGDGAEILELVYDEDEEYIVGIKTDGAFDVTDALQEYGVRIQCATFDYGLVYITKKVTVTRAGVYKDFTFDIPISLDELVLPAIGDILSFGILQKISYESICMGKKCGNDGTYTLTLVPYNEGIYNADSGQLPDFESKTTSPNYFTPPKGKSSTPTVEDLQNVKNDIIDIENGDYEIGDPDTPTGLTAVAEKDGIRLSWNPVNNDGLRNAIKQYVLELSKNSGQTYFAFVAVSTTDYFFQFVRTGTGSVGFPEASDFDEWKFRIKAENLYGGESEYAETIVDTQSYGTWHIPEITAIKEVIDRTAIIKVVYATPEREVYGVPKTEIRIKRIGNNDMQGEKTFNELLGITADNQWYKPEFNKSVQPSKSSDTEPNYRTSATGYYRTDLYQFSHTLPLIGQTERLFNDGEYVCLATDVDDYSTVPQNPEEGDVIRYTGDPITGFATNHYYLYTDSEWVEVTCKMMLVPTTYKYQLRMTNESGYYTDPIEVEITALCTNIADIVHSHEHYKDLYVEKLSAISANMGLIKQGGMGSFEDLMNYWALSDLSAEDSGVPQGVKKGAFRVGGADQYFKVTPLGNNQYDIELRAGNITLTTGGDGTSFKQGTYIYDSSDDKKRLALTASGIIAQKNTSNTSVPNWVNVAQVRTDAVGNLIVTNTENFEDTLPIGTQVNGTIYHFDDRAHPEYEEANVPSNPQNITCTGEVKDTKELTPILLPDSSKKCFEGTVEKDVSNFTGKMVLFSKSNKLLCSGIFVTPTGIEDNAGDYNELMTESKGSGTVGSYLGLSSSQISNGIFVNY